ncbi:MAG: DUF819 family protein [Halioglobus sp.]|nr:DUF819 family protein [Halioglobus sp.]
MLNAVILLAAFAIPAGLIWLTHHQAWARKIGIIVLCYLAGLALGNTGVLPAGTLAARTTITEATIALAMPLLLFSLDIRSWRRVAGKAMLSMLFATASVTTLATALFFVFDSRGLESASHFAAMSVGIYTGGTPNLAAIKAGLEIPHAQYLIFHSLDTIVGSLYLLFMLTAGIPLMRHFLPAAPNTATAAGDQHDFAQDNYAPLLQPNNWSQLGIAAALAVAVVATAMGFESLYNGLVGGASGAAVLIVAITSLGILLSLSSRVRALTLSYDLGMYLIYVFCFVVSSMADLKQLADVDWTIGLFLSGTIFGSLLLHGLLCRVARVDADTYIVTSVAAIASPPFVPLIARALGNPAAILTGITTGIIGYAIGNYIGISLGLLLKSL